MNKLIQISKTTFFIEIIFSTLAVVACLYFQKQYFKIEAILLIAYGVSLIALIIEWRLMVNSQRKIKVSESFYLTGHVINAIRGLCVFTLIGKEVVFLMINLNNLVAESSKYSDYLFIILLLIVWNIFSIFNIVAFILLAKANRNMRLLELD